MNETFALWGLAVAALLATWVLTKAAKQRLELSIAKHPSLTGHARMAQRVVAQLPGYAYDAHRFFNADKAPAEAVSRRRAGLARLSALFADRYPRSLALSTQAERGLSDLQFTGACRVPFPFSPYLHEQLKVASFVLESAGVTLTDLDGNVFYDLTGSYGVNVFGHDFYKQCIAEGSARAQALGPVLGSYHPC